MALIKGRHAGGVAMRGFEDLGDLRLAAEEFLRQARAEASLIIEDARHKARQLVEEAGPKGHAEGRAHGLEEGRAEGRRQGRDEAIEEYRGKVEALVSAWTTALDTFEADRHDILAAAREEVLELALALGEKVTHRVIDADPSVAGEQVAKALALVTEPSEVVVRVNPADRKLVDSVLGELFERMVRAEHVELADDEDVRRGGCVVTTGKGRVDAGIDRQIERIAETLLGRKRAR